MRPLRHKSTYWETALAIDEGIDEETLTGDGVRDFSFSEEIAVVVTGFCVEQVSDFYDLVISDLTSYSVN